MSDHPVLSIEIDYHNNNYGYILSICTESNNGFVITPNNKEITASDTKDCFALRKTPINKKRLGKCLMKTKKKEQQLFRHQKRVNKRENYKH